jgi:outer membrane phospholipase A
MKSITKVAVIAVFILCTINSVNAEDTLKDNKIDNTEPTSDILCILNAYPNDMLDIVRKGGSNLTSYRPMYIGYSVYENGKDRDGEINFQISFKYNIGRDFYLGYTQKSLWDIKDSSAPIKETDLSPEILYIHNNDNCEFGDNTWLPYQYMLMGLRHESNGVKGANSVGWNMVYIEPFFATPKYKSLAVSTALWYPFTNSRNKVLVDDIGIGKLTVKWQPINLFQLSSGFRHGLKGKTYGFENKIDFYIDPSKKWFSPTIFVQVWKGYGDTLESHALKTTKIVIGFSATR